MAKHLLSWYLGLLTWLLGLIGLKFETPSLLKGWMEAPPPPPPVQHDSALRRFLGLGREAAEAPKPAHELVGVFGPLGQSATLGPNATLLGARVVDAAEGAPPTATTPPPPRT